MHFTLNELTTFDSTLTPAINHLLRQLTSTEVNFSDTDQQTLIDACGTHLFLLKTEEHLIGMLTLGEYIAPTGRKWWIEDVVVDQLQRGQGWGQKLIEQAIHYVQQAGGCALMLTSKPQRLAANKLYRRMGFQQRDTNVYKMVL